MSIKMPFCTLASALLLATAVFPSGTASALSLSTYVLPIYQIGSGAQVSLGHAVSATTNYNRLIAGGTYSAVCAAAEMLPTTGQRTLPSEGFSGPRSLTVTIPAVLPGRVNMPGFNAAAMRGMRLDCTYNWTSRAVEGQFSVGPGGVGYTIGGGEASEGGTQLFTMNVPSGTDPNEGSTCLP